jgi:hypothetical protein
LTISSPYNIGNDTNVLDGLFNASSVNAVGIFGVSFTNLFMGYGYSRVTTLDPRNNFAAGLDFSIGITTGLSINIWSNSSIC